MINLLPYKEKESIERLRRLRMVKTVVSGLALLIVIGGVLLVPTFLTINSRFAIATSQITTLERDGTMVSAVDVESLQKRVQAASKKLAVPATVSPTTYIATVQNTALSAITLTRFVTKPEGLDVYGVAKTRADLQAFIARLEADSTIARVDSPVSNFVKSTGSQFMIVVTFK